MPYLQGGLRPKQLAHFPHVARPIQAHHISVARLLHKVELACAPVGVENEGGVGVGEAHALHHSVGVGERELGELRGRQVVGPRVKQLDHLRGENRRDSRGILRCLKKES